MLYLIGLGLTDGDISSRALKALKESDKVFAEFYTSPNVFDLGEIEEETGKEIEVLGREEVEQEEKVLESAKERKTAFLVSGDPVTATTHYEFFYRAKKENIDTEIFHAPSIFTAVAETGLNIYKFGRTTTLPKKEGDYLPDSPYEIVKNNLKNNLHTLLLVDPDHNSKSMYEVLDELEEKGEEEIFTSEREVFFLHKVGGKESNISLLKFGDLKERCWSGPITLIIPAEMSPQEEKFSEQFR